MLDVKNFIDKCTLPILQDTDKIKAWQEMGGQKDDFYVYDSAGKLVHYLPISGGPMDTVLTTKTSYDALFKLLKTIK